MGACATSKDPQGDRQPGFFDAMLGQNAYIKTFYKFTQKKRTQSEFDVVLLAELTFWSPEMRRAYITEKSMRFGFTEEEEKALAFEQFAEDESFYVFILAATTRNPNWNDFTNPESIWRLKLKSPGYPVELRPTRIEKVDYKSEKWAYFYPSSTRFNTIYRVYFPKENAQLPGDLQLSISGPRGYLNFSFEQAHMAPVK